MTLGLTALALTTVSLIAMLGPGLRAARMDPLRALREE
jgi:ABC-type antimicrobial peptide transport system permease subunit